LQLNADGSFPTVTQAICQGWVEGKQDPQGNRDAIIVSDRHATTVINPYYPDTGVNYLRVDAYHVSDNASISRVLDAASFLSLYEGSAWPDANIARIRLEAASDGDHGQPSIASGLAMADDIPGQAFDHLGVQQLQVNLPKGHTVVLVICSTCKKPGAKDSKDPCPKIHLAHVYDNYRKTAQPAAVSAAAIQALRLLGLSPMSQSLKSLAQAPDIDPDRFLDGSVDMVSPYRIMTLVHAVKRPLKPPDFTKDIALTVQRSFGSATATVSGSLDAHWMTTGKITCNAQWEDIIDDPRTPLSVHSALTMAFEVTAAGTADPNKPEEPLCDFGGSGAVTVLQEHCMVP
jgi:hypothetical protein